MIRAPRRRIHYALALGLISLWICCKTDLVLEIPNFYDSHSVEALDRIPIVLVGLVQVAKPVTPYKLSRYEEGLYTRLWCAHVKVENVLKGNVNPGETDILYYVAARNMGSSASSLQLNRGDRKLFFLMTDSGHLRTIFDDYSTAVISVTSGAHPNFRRDPDRPIGEAIVSILLTRGVRSMDYDMLEALYYFADSGGRFGKKVEIPYLVRLSQMDTLPVREQACLALRNTQYKCKGIKERMNFSKHPHEPRRN